MTFMGQMAWCTLALLAAVALHQAGEITLLVARDMMAIRLLRWRQRRAWRQVERAMARARKFEGKVDKLVARYHRITKECDDGVQAVLERQP